LGARPRRTPVVQDDNSNKQSIRRASHWLTNLARTF
jgi:hypothetical protein